MGRAEWTDKRLSETDIHILRGFIAQALQPFVPDMADFYFMIDGLDMSTGKHSWALMEHGNGALGYMVVREGPRDFRSTSVFPYVNPSKLNIGVPGSTKPSILDVVLEEPLPVEDFYVYYKRGKLCFLTEELHEAEMNQVRLQAAVLVSRKEACALLDGKMLGSMRDKICKAFGLKEER